MLRNIAKARLRKVYSRTPRKHTAAPDCAMGRIGSTRHSHAVRDNGTMPVMNDEVPGVAGIERETTSMAHDGTRFTSSHGSSDGHSVTTPTRNTNRWLPALKAAFPLTIPICLGFLFLGASYGILSGTIVYMLLVQLVF